MKSGTDSPGVTVDPGSLPGHIVIINTIIADRSGNNIGHSGVLESIVRILLIADGTLQELRNGKTFFLFYLLSKTTNEG